MRTKLIFRVAAIALFQSLLPALLSAEATTPTPPTPTTATVVPVVVEPHIQMLVPGFTVRELPVSLTNINNVRYRSDGKLVALGYNGRIWLLSDTDGDGLEDTATPFWDPPTLSATIGMALTPKKRSPRRWRLCRR